VGVIKLGDFSRPPTILVYGSGVFVGRFTTYVAVTVLTQT
jgi:hypothetical protein